MRHNQGRMRLIVQEEGAEVWTLSRFCSRFFVARAVGRARESMLSLCCSIALKIFSFERGLKSVLERDQEEEDLSRTKLQLQVQVEMSNKRGFEERERLRRWREARSRKGQEGAFTKRGVINKNGVITGRRAFWRPDGRANGRAKDADTKNSNRVSPSPFPIEKDGIAFDYIEVCTSKINFLSSSGDRCYLRT